MAMKIIALIRLQLRVEVFYLMRRLLCFLSCKVKIEKNFSKMND